MLQAPTREHAANGVGQQQKLASGLHRGGASWAQRPARQGLVSGPGLSCDPDASVSRPPSGPHGNEGRCPGRVLERGHCKGPHHHQGYGRRSALRPFAPLLPLPLPPFCSHHRPLFCVGRDYDVDTTEKGEFWRLLLPGDYEVTIKAEGYQEKVLCRKGRCSAAAVGLWTTGCFFPHPSPRPSYAPRPFR